MALEVTQDDWPPSPPGRGSKDPRPFQFVWTHFPAAKSHNYATRTASRTHLQTPMSDTLARFREDMAVQVGFTMDVMLNCGSRGRVAMVFNPVGAGAFVDRLPGEQQSRCLEVILYAILGEFQKRISHPCVLFLSGAVNKPGTVTWRNKLGREATVDVPRELKDRLFIGAFDCLSLAQRLATEDPRVSVCVTMAADKHRIGNAFLSIREDRMQRGRWQFSAQNAADENNTRRSSLLPSVLHINAPHFDWQRLTEAEYGDAHAAARVAEQYLAAPSEDKYSVMMGVYQRLLWKGALARALDRRCCLSIPHIAVQCELPSIRVTPLGNAH